MCVMSLQVVATVTVGVRPQLVGRPAELDVTVGDEATFECKYRALPTPDVYWYHNKQPLTVSALPLQPLLSSGHIYCYCTCCHVTAFRPISEAAHSWSYDNQIC